MKHSKTKSTTGSRPLCFYLAPETAILLQRIATREGRSFYQQAAKLIDEGIQAYISHSSHAERKLGSKKEHPAS